MRVREASVTGRLGVANLDTRQVLGLTNLSRSLPLPSLSCDALLSFSSPDSPHLHVNHFIYLCCYKEMNQLKSEKGGL